FSLHDALPIFKAGEGLVKCGGNVSVEDRQVPLHQGDVLLDVIVHGSLKLFKPPVPERFRLPHLFHELEMFRQRDICFYMVSGSRPVCRSIWFGYFLFSGSPGIPMISFSRGGHPQPPVGWISPDSPRAVDRGGSSPWDRGLAPSARTRPLVHCVPGWLSARCKFC